MGVGGPGAALRAPRAGSSHTTKVIGR
jgi:hypothetical protein